MSEYVVFEWKQPNDPIVASRNMEALARDLTDLEPVLEASKQVVLADVEEHFQEEKGPDGDAWAEWSPSYAPVAERKNIGKLRRRDTLDLYHAATDEGAYE